MLRVVSTLRPLLRGALLPSPKPLPRRPPRLFRALSSSAPLAASPPSAPGVAEVREEHLVRCAAAGRAPLRVAVLLSGGVDSSVALRLLHAAGHSCTAFYLKIWFQVRERSRVRVFCNVYAASEAPYEAGSLICRKISGIFGPSARGTTTSSMHKLCVTRYPKLSAGALHAVSLNGLVCNM